MKTYSAKKDMGSGFSVEYRVKAESKEEALRKIREISGEYILKVKEV